MLGARCFLCAVDSSVTSVGVDTGQGHVMVSLITDLRTARMCKYVGSWVGEGVRGVSEMSQKFSHYLERPPPC